MNRHRKLDDSPPAASSSEEEDVSSEEESEKIEEGDSSDHEEGDSSDHEEGVSEESGTVTTDPHADLKETLSTMSFEELQKLQERIGSKVFNQATAGGGGKTSRNIAACVNQRTFKRANKNRPMEISSKRPTRRLKDGGVAVKRKTIRDPRFDDLSGDYDEKLFQQSYGFIDGLKAREKTMLSKKLKKCENPTERAKIRRLLDRFKQQENTRKQKEKTRETEKMLKNKEKELVESGKSPFYLKKSEKKKLELADKFKELKESGKLEQYLSKKRKKLATKDKKRLPPISQ
ncbi:ribosomal RNA processing protein 36 homolog isoform X2 [Tubulanus polymorphus]